MCGGGGRLELTCAPPLQLKRTYNTYGIGIDPRHLQLLADVMTYRGEVRACQWGCCDVIAWAGKNQREVFTVAILGWSVRYSRRVRAHFAGPRHNEVWHREDEGLGAHAGVL